MKNENVRIILASKSPRRKELLGRLFPEFEIITAPTDETLPENMHPREGVGILAVRKGEAVLPLVGEDDLVISADTLVELSGTPLGKPADKDEAVSMLLTLSGKTHNVHTGIAVHYRGRVFFGVDSSGVSFREISPEEAMEYVNTGEPLDKAGAYAIQGIGAKFVKEYSGEFESIVGLSTRLTKRLIDEALSND